MNFCAIVAGRIFIGLLLLTGVVEAQTGWLSLQSGTIMNLRSVNFINVDTGFVAGEAGTVLKTIDAGVNWLDISIPQSLTIHAVFFFDADTGLVVGDNGTIFRTIDGGINWNIVPSGVTDHLLSVTFFDNNGICGASSQTILFSTDRGNSWNIAQSGLFEGGFYAAVMLSPQIGFVGGENSIFQPLVGKTADSGVSWSFNAFLLGNNEGKIFGIEFTDLSRGYAVSAVWDGRGAISKTVDGGANWTTLFFNDVIYGIDFPISAASLVGYAVGAAGIILNTADAGGSWQFQVSPVASTLKGLHFLDFNNGYVVGDGGIILKTTSGGMVSVPDFKTADFNFAEKFRLHQNYPNPFNLSTTIEFALPQAGFVNLKIYNILGEEVATLVSERLPAGKYKYDWDASGLASGIYFYKIHAGNVIKTHKMVILK